MTETKLCNLSDRSVIRISGSETRSFLQGLITNDIEKLDQEGSLYAALLTPQGKILFDFFVVRSGDAILLDCAREQAGELVKRLTFYRLRAAVEIEDLSSTHGVLASWGDNPAVPELDGATTFKDPRHSGMGLRTLAAEPAIDNMLQGHDSAGNESCYHAHRIALGLPDSIRDIGSGEMFPHECNMDQLGAVDFKKGCYIGQEVVSRTEHRGTARKRVLPIRTEGADPSSGDVITAGSKPIGTVLSHSGPQALALVRLDRAASALENGDTLEAPSGAVHLLRPTWVQYPVPGT